MRVFFKALFFALSLVFALTNNLTAQNISNEGSDFWVCFPDHIPAGSQLATMSIFVTSKSNSSGKVICGTSTQNFTVLANTVTEVPVPRNVSFIGPGTGIQTNKGIRVVTNAGQANIVVYAHVFAGARSAASLVLPYEALGQKHFAMAFDQVSNNQINNSSQFNIVAADANTKINISPVINGVAGTTFSITLANAGDVYQYQNSSDISGSLIEVDSVSSGCKRIAAFSGSNAIGIGTTTCNPLLPPAASLDPLFQQLYPTQSWGNTYPLIPFFNRNTGSIFRVLAASDGTVITVNGVTVNLDAGKFYSSPPINTPSIIKSNKPISVAQFALTQYCSDSRNATTSNAIVGDPDMVILNPLEYSIDKITLYSSSKLAISEQYINVVIPTNKKNTFKINNTNFGSSFIDVPNSPEFSYAQIQLNAIGGSNFSLAADTGFNAIAYGFGFVESYAYSAGTSLASTTVVNALRSSTNEIVKIACITDQYDFRLLLPYKPTKLVWLLEPTATPIVQDNPPSTQVVVNNKTLFQFTLQASKSFATSGNKQIKITSTLPANSNVCSTTDEETINFNLEVVDLPIAEFTSNTKVCVTLPLQFTYVEKNIGEPVIKWLWDFGDGTTSTLKDPSHTYNTIGNYKVKLSIQSTIGCSSAPFEKTISVIKPLTPAFSTQNPLCVGNSIMFIDETTSTDGFTSWAWDFGNGNTSNSKNSSQIFNTAGNYTVKLVVTSQTGCIETISKIIKINNPAQIDFVDPGSCINDLVKFDGLVLGGTVATWLWDFGDGTNDVLQKNKQNAEHRYLSTGTYNVKLQAISTDGCISTLTKTVIISGSNPKVSFDVINKDNLCSNTAVTFKNTSTIVFGNIVRLEIIYQYSTTGNNIIFTDNNPTPGKEYTFKYPASSVNRNYQVVFRAYSGQNCFQESVPITITVNGSPTLTFTPVTPVCLNTPRFLFTNARENTGIAGTGVLEGKGIVNGFFDPAVAGVGTHLIKYTFTSPKGCTEQVSGNVIVSPLPTVDAGEDLFILLEGEKQIKAIATGSNIKYKWTPSLGLSNDSIANPVATPKVTTKYTLTITSKDGCAVADEVIVNVIIDPMIPNVFSPNGDAINDTWVIKYLETFVNATIKIYNRYGQQVFFAQQYNTPWDGRYNGQDMPVGVYYFMIEPNNGRNRYTGSVTLLR
jgi:gliding motility-associated-like protein